jgi:hypothetical protein
VKISIKTEIEKRIPLIHQLAVEKGWWDGGVENRDVFDIVNNFHAEVSEAWEEYRAGRMDLWWTYDGTPIKDGVRGQKGLLGLLENGAMFAAAGCLGPYRPPILCKPEGFWVELADLCIRVMDCFGAYNWETVIGKVAEDGDEKLSIPAIVSILHSDIECTFDGSNRTAFWLFPELHCSYLTLSAIHSAESHGVNLFELIDLKHEYNKTRPHRHGDKLA